jgi:hypothetical protein
MTPGQANPDQPNSSPTMALRTYRFLRIGAVAVIAVLAVALLKEYDRAGDCLQGSISAYYFTPVQSVFVGALVALGLVMIALWGKTLWEDGLFNLAGMLAPVVAFVPTAETRKCGLTDPFGEPVRTDQQELELIRDSHAAVDNNMYAYLVVVGIVLLALVVVGLIAHLKTTWHSVVDRPLVYWLPLAAAAALWAFGADKYWGIWGDEDRPWIYDDAHKPAAIVLFIFIVAAIIVIGVDKLRGNATRQEAPHKGWAVTYWALAVVMTAGAAAMKYQPEWFPQELGDRQTFWIEAWMIAGLAIFWSLQTWDRWSDRAPPRTKEEVAAAAAAAPAPAK